MTTRVDVPVPQHWQMSMGKHDRLWVCPKCGVTMRQPPGVKSVSHDCPKTDPLVFVTLERTYTASTG